MSDAINLKRDEAIHDMDEEIRKETQKQRMNIHKGLRTHGKQDTDAEEIMQTLRTIEETAKHRAEKKFRNEIRGYRENLNYYAKVEAVRRLVAMREMEELGDLRLASV
jgi:uncharacterized membrane protein